MCRDLLASLRKLSEKIIKLRANHWGIQPDWALAWVWGTGYPCYGWVHIYSFFIWALQRYLWTIPQNNNFKKIISEVLILLKIAKFLQKKIFARVLQLLLSLNELLILLKIPCKIVLRIVQILQNVEYLTLSLAKMLNFDNISELKTSLNFQQKAKVYLMII